LLYTAWDGLSREALKLAKGHKRNMLELTYLLSAGGGTRLP
jgi:hypothetical protein